MSAVEIGDEIQSYIEQVKDESFLRVVHSMLSTYIHEQPESIVSHDIDGTPRTSSVLTAILDAEIAAGERGEFMTIEDFQKESAKWGLITK
jgi:hypothetical protein